MRQSIRLLLAIATLLALSNSLKAQLGTALNTNLTWSTSGTGGTFGWSSENTTTHDGVMAAQSGILFSSTSSATLQTTVTGPGTLSFWWTIPTYIGGGDLYFIVGNSTQAVSAVSPSPSMWQQMTVYIGSGSQTLKWLYKSTGTGLSAPNCYLDEVSYTQGATAPFITNQPPSQSQVPGMATLFQVGADGTPPLAFQWQFNGTNIAGATNTTFTITNTTAENLGSYHVVITNSVDSITSTDATLEFGELTAWGFSFANQTAIPPGATNLLAIGGGGNFSWALKSDRTPMVWGSNQYGQCDIPPEATNIIQLAAGWGHMLGLRADGQVVAWGRNDSGQVTIPAGLSNVVKVSAGTAHSLVLKSDGTVVAWGSNWGGQTNVPVDLTNAVSISTTTDHNLALRANAAVIAWGANYDGQTNTPSGLNNVTAISAGGRHSVILKADGTVLAWGTPSSFYNTTNVPSGLSNVIAISAGYLHTLALKSDRTVVAWGWSSAGQTNTPATLSNVVMIAAGSYHSLAAVANEPPIQQATATNATVSETGFALSIPSQSGFVYALEYKDSLSDSNWIAKPLVAGTGDTIILNDPSPAAAHRFYRVRRW